MNRMKPAGNFEQFYVKKRNSSESAFNRAVHNRKLEFMSKCFHASWLTHPLCIIFLDGNLVCRSTKLAEVILFIWTPPLVGFGKLNSVECFLK